MSRRRLNWPAVAVVAVMAAWCVGVVMLIFPKSAEAAPLLEVGMRCTFDRQRVEVLQLQPMTDGKTRSMGAFVRGPESIWLIDARQLSECRL